MTTSPGGGPSGRLPIGFACLLASLISLSSMSVAVALPDLRADLDADVAGASWVVGSYLVAMAAFQAVGGRLGDRLGRRRVVIGGVAAFGLASLAGALAPDIATLLVARALQGLAGAVIFPNAAALLREQVPPERAASAHGLFGAAIAVGAAVAAPVGGLLVEAFDWRAVFVFNLPPILLALVLAPRAVARTRPLEARGPLDLAGAALLVVVLGGAAVLLESADDTAPALVVAVGVALAALLWIFVRLELRHPDPVVQPRFFESREFSAASFCVGTGNLALYGVVVAVPLAFSAHAGWEADEIGAVLAAATVTIAVFAGVGGRAVSRWGCRVVGFAGGAAFALGLVPLAVAGTDLSRLELAAALALAGVGAGLATTVTRMAALEALDARDAGSASGIFLTARYFGAIVATSLVGIAGGAAGAGDAAWQALFVGCLASAALSALAALALSDTGRVAALAR